METPARQLGRSMNLSIASGATSAQLGLLVGMLSLASIMQLPAILIYRRLPRRKTFWISTSVIHRFNGPVLAAVAYRVSQGGSKERGITIIMVAMVASWIITNLSSSGWWSWMADLVPIRVRARFFGRRSAVAQVVNIVAFFTTTVVLDAAVGDNRFVVYAVVFLIGGLGGIADILLHILMPEPSAAAVASTNSTAATFCGPLRDRNFLRFALTTGLVLFSINVSAPFFAPYITDPGTIGAPNTWLGIMFVISQMTWIAVSSGWGTVMDRFGRKPVVMIGLLFTVSWFGYLVVSPTNYVVVLPVIAMLGGVLDDFFATHRLSLGFLTIEGFHGVVLTSLILVGVSLLVLSRVDEGPTKPVSYVFSRVATPGIFRTLMNIGVLARTESSERVVRTLRAIDSASDDLAAEQVLERIHDPDPDVREEAIRISWTR